MKNFYIYFCLLLLVVKISFAQQNLGAIASATKPVMRGQAASKNDMMMPKNVKMLMTNGAFVVDAWKEDGIRFRNDWNEPMNYYFQVNINDDWGYGQTSFIGPSGREENYYALPYGKFIGALVAVKSSGKYKALEACGVMKFTLQPGESVQFLMNDRKGTYGDNSGSVYVRWTCESQNPQPTVSSLQPMLGELIPTSPSKIHASKPNIIESDTELLRFAADGTINDRELEGLLEDDMDILTSMKPMSKPKATVTSPKKATAIPTNKELAKPAATTKPVAKPASTPVAQPKVKMLCE